ncbi:Uncharacterised protein [[Clostridium] sordellii]|uniref:DUF5665 domain-containing protein n=1 Tax=Paraclostridium sordellii TaxID=1505 RepID=UPI0005E7366F|nr:DUF5665 domain-containing protein [Paeniclostridium sordellii]CEN76685.1 Uncharacterised protein [[Clostridium] sordellii] [Paeniclostridium sordellii]
MKKYRTGNKMIIKVINMKDIDKKIHGDENDQVYLRTLNVVNNKLDDLMYIIERSRIREFMILTDSRRRMFTTNFIAGIGKGFGQAIGFSILTAIFIYFISKWVNLPIIGAYLAEFLDIVDKYRRK